MTLRSLWSYLAVALPVLAALLANLSTVDLAYHLRAGGELLETGRISTTDSWTYTAAGQPWLNQQWGAQLVLAAVYEVGGWTGLVLLRAVLVGLIAGLVYRAGRRQGLEVRPAAWLTLAAFTLASVALALRPQLFGMALFALVLLLVVERRRDRRLLWLVPPIVLVWANLHGSFFLGPGVLVAAWLADVHDRAPQARQTLIVAVLSTAAAFVNPFGPQVWAYAAGLTTNPLVTERITEWQPTSLRSVPGVAFFASVLAVFALLARRADRVSWPALLWFAGFFVVGVWAIRGVAWWPIAAAVGVAGVLGTGFLGSGSPHAPAPARRERPKVLNAVVAATLVVAGVVLLPMWRPVDPALAAPTGVVGNAPPGITAVIRDRAEAGDRLYNPQPWSSWFELAVPALTVAVDSRIELYPSSVWDDFDTVAAGRDGWADVLERWGVSMIVATEGRERGLLERLADDASWTQVHADDDGLVYVRTDAG